MNKQEQKIRETLDELIAEGTVKPLRRHKVALGDTQVVTRMGQSAENTSEWQHIAGVSLGAVAFANGRWVAVGIGGILTFTDGVSWEHVVTVDMRQGTVTFANGRWVAVGMGGIFTSTDGVSWEHVVTVDMRQGTVTFANGRWVANGTGGIFTSTDGVSWEHVVTGGILLLIFANDRWVAAPSASGGSGMLTSTDGVSWERVVAGSVTAIEGTTFANGRWVANGTGGIFTSIDGVSWQHVWTIGVTNAPRGLVFANGRWVVAGNQGIFISANGILWERVVTVTMGQGTVTFANGRWVAAGLSGIFTSTDGVSWEHVVTGNANPRVVAFENGRWVVASVSGIFDGILTSTDGVSWEHVVTGTVLALTFANGRWVAAGLSGIFTSIDGVSWEHVVTVNMFPDGVAFADGRWVVVSSGGTTGIFTSLDFAQCLFSEIRNFHLDASPEIIGFRDPDNDPPEKILPLLEGGTGQKYLPVKDGTQVVGKVHVIDEVIDKTATWSIPHANPDVISIDQEGVITIPDPDEVDPIYKIRLTSQYNKRFEEVLEGRLPEWERIAEFNLPGLDWRRGVIAYGNGRFVVMVPNLPNTDRPVLFVSTDDSDNRIWTRVNLGSAYNNWFGAGIGWLAFDEERQRFITLSGESMPVSTFGNGGGDRMATSEDGFAWSWQRFTGEVLSSPPSLGVGRIAEFVSTTGLLVGYSTNPILQGAWFRSVADFRNIIEVSHLTIAPQVMFAVGNGVYCLARPPGFPGYVSVTCSLNGVVWAPLERIYVSHELTNSNAPSTPLVFDNFTLIFFTRGIPEGQTGFFRLPVGKKSVFNSTHEMMSAFSPVYLSLTEIRAQNNADRGATSFAWGAATKDNAYGILLSFGTFAVGVTVESEAYLITPDGLTTKLPYYITQEIDGTEITHSLVFRDVAYGNGKFVAIGLPFSAANMSNGVIVELTSPSS